MSATEHPVSQGHEVPHGDGHHAPLGTMRDYVIGFLLSVVLTAIPFWLVMGGPPLPRGVVVFIIVAFAVIQMVVHVVYFLHLKSGSEDGWNLTSLVFTLILVVITLAGSIWVMYHLDGNTMPMHEAPASF
jgi:cytochrome o ubiquinol oxidase operon protein cyoD